MTYLNQFPEEFHVLAGGHFIMNERSTVLHHRFQALQSKEAHVGVLVHDLLLDGGSCMLGRDISLPDEVANLQDAVPVRLQKQVTACLVCRGTKFFQNSESIFLLPSMGLA